LGREERRRSDTRFPSPLLRLLTLTLQVVAVYLSAAILFIFACGIRRDLAHLGGLGAPQAERKNP
jgi:hypothetical protein